MNRKTLSGFSPVEKALCLYFLHRKLKDNSNTFTLGQKKLVKIIGRHENSISRALKSLERKGWVTREQKDKLNIITFSPPLKDLQRLLCFSSRVASYSLANENQREELLKINTNLKQERDLLRDELDKRLKHDAKINKVLSQISDDQIGEFIDDLLTILGDVFDNRPNDEKIIIAIKNFQVKLGLREPTKTIKERAKSQDQYPDFVKWNPSGVANGYDSLKQIGDD